MPNQPPVPVGGGEAGPVRPRRPRHPTGDPGPRLAGFAACGLDGKPPNAAQARRFVAATLGDWSLDALIPEAQLIVGELVGNAVRHAVDPGSPADGEYPVWLGVFLRSTELVCAVADPSSRPPRPASAGRPGPGSGLALIAEVSADWSWEPTPPRGKTVWASLALAPAAPGRVRPATAVRTPPAVPPR
ncbi:ATP-binding protein [Streptomyces sp. NPDC006798]|uniref:ATP-binding protein n=1 Tax=Streptomyces sp. NPDC006798 TaxID=3155462 RepID=UPI003404757F